MNIKIEDSISPIFTTYYTLMGRNAYNIEWFHIFTGTSKEGVESMKSTNNYEYYKIISFDLETYDDEQLYQLYYRQKKMGRLKDEMSKDDDKN